MKPLDDVDAAQGGQSPPRGGRGLKLLARSSATEPVVSPPARGARIETYRAELLCQALQSPPARGATGLKHLALIITRDHRVAPRAGGAD